MRSIQTNPMIFMSDRLSVAFSFSRRAHYPSKAIIRDKLTKASKYKYSKTIIQDNSTGLPAFIILYLFEIMCGFCFYLG